MFIVWTKIKHFQVLSHSWQLYEFPPPTAALYRNILKFFCLNGNEEFYQACSLIAHSFGGDLVRYPTKVRFLVIFSNSCERMSIFLFSNDRLLFLYELLFYNAYNLMYTQLIIRINPKLNDSMVVETHWNFRDLLRDWN